MVPKECDIVTTIASTIKRIQVVDFTHVPTYGSTSNLIPSFDSSAVNVFAATQPFPSWVTKKFKILQKSFLIFFFQNM